MCLPARYLFGVINIKTDVAVGRIVTSDKNRGKGENVLATADKCCYNVDIVWKGDDGRSL